MLCSLINRLTEILYHKAYKQFTCLKDVQKVQEEKLLSYIRENKDSAFGRKYLFNDLRNAADYQKNVPFTTYEDYLPYIDRIMAGEENVLTKERVLLMELTSGSTSASKLIPYTSTLKEEFQAGLKPWIYDLYHHVKGVTYGKSYWSITPAASVIKEYDSKIPIGFEEDGEYFGKLEEHLFNLIFAVNGEVRHEKSMEGFYYKTVLSLIKTRNLSLISIWNPTFLLLLLNYMKEHSGELSLSLSTERAATMKIAIEKENYSLLWDRLTLISCWCDGNAAVYSGQVEKLFPKAVIQAKGLLATECFVSFPLVEQNASVLSINSHFFEFISLEDESVFLAHELKMDTQYEVVVTTGGGLYRYRMGDVVQVKGFFRSLPLLKFIGRRDSVSDLFGEKLSEGFVKSVCDKIEADFYLLAPDENCYILYLQGGRETSAKEIDDGLRENFHYDYCRKLGQLKPLKIFNLTGNPNAEYLEECVKRGQRLGDIKPPALSLKKGWDKILKGEFQ